MTPSEHIPRIQEAQATAYHVLRELVELPELTLALRAANLSSKDETDQGSEAYAALVKLDVEGDSRARASALTG